MQEIEHEFRFTYRVMSDYQFDATMLQTKFPILSRKEFMTAEIPHLTINPTKNYFVVCVHQFYVAFSDWDDDLLISKLDEIIKILPPKNDRRQELCISLLPEVYEFEYKVSTKILSYLSQNNINLGISGIF